MVSVAGYSALKLAGWAFVNKEDVPRVNISIALVNQSSRDVQVFDVKRLERADVIDAHKNLSAKIYQPGFEALIRTDTLTEGHHTIWVVLTVGEASHIGKDVGFISAVLTQRRLEVEDGNYGLTDSTKAAN